MKITTSDGISISRFEKIPNIAKKLMGSEQLSKIQPEDSAIRYGKYTVKINNEKELTDSIPTLLTHMSLYNWTGKISRQSISE
jgi:hypothetical protein